MRPIAKRQLEQFARGLVTDDHGWVQMYCGHHKSGARAFYRDGIVRLRCKACNSVIVDLQIAEDPKVVIPARKIISS